MKKNTEHFLPAITEAAVPRYANKMPGINNRLAIAKSQFISDE